MIGMNDVWPSLSEGRGIDLNDLPNVVILYIKMTTQLFLKR